MTRVSAPTAPAFFQTGGTLPYNAPSYVERQADRELLQKALAGDFCYVLTPRQMGKSSLMVRTARSLQERGVRTAIVDLTSIGTHVTESQWYLGLLKQISNQLKLRLDLNNWWQIHEHSGAVARFREFFAEIILVQLQTRIVIFIDEIDSTLGLPFSDDFFAAVRALYNERAVNAEWQRLTFVFLGVVTPADLIKNPARTPFNIGQEIPLPEFQWGEAAPLREEVCRIFPQDGERIFKRIFYWTNGQPYLTQQLCATIAAQPTESWNQAAIDGLVRRLFLSDAAQGETNIRSVSDKILNHPRKAALLRLYGQVYRGKLILDEKQSLLQSQLKLSGLVKVEAGRLQVRNELYRQAFNQRWIRQNTDLNWYAVSSGVLALILGLFLIIFAYDTMWVAGQAESARLTFYENAAVPERRAGAMVRLLRLHPILFGDSSERAATELFFSLSSWEEQKGIYDSRHFTDPDDLTLMVQQVYGRLVNVDDTTATNSSGMLVRMRESLQAFPDHEAAAALVTEISHWLQAREAFLAGDDPLAIARFELAVQSNGQNPATRFELARVQIRQGETEAALANLDRVLAIAANEAYQIEPTGTPTVAAAATEETTETATRTAENATAVTQEPEVTISPTGQITPTSALPLSETPAAEIVSPSPGSDLAYTTVTPTPGPVRARFDSQSDMIEAVRNLVESQGDLIAFLTQAPAATYPNLERVIAAPTVTLEMTTTTPPTIPPSIITAFTPGTVTLTPTSTRTTQPILMAAATSGIQLGSSRTSLVDGMTQLYVPGGNFLMGSTDSDSNASGNEKPQHQVYLDAFWIDQTEVTNAQYVLFLNMLGGHLGQCANQNCVQTKSENIDSHIVRQDASYGAEDSFADHPVINVSWYGANAYCEWAGRRLPTEAEWEKAARGADGRIYPWGNIFDGTRLNYCDSNCEFDGRDTNVDDGYARTAPGGSYTAGASPYGALDMAGNVWEWVADWYDGDYYQNSPDRNPRGPTSGSSKMLRGGAWNHYIQNARGADRLNDTPAALYVNLGFRCAQDSTSLVHLSTGTPTPTSTPQPIITATIGRVSEVTGMIQLFVPAGRFLMGSADSDMLADDDERPQHEVYLDAFWIDKTEVTHAQYVEFLNSLSDHKGQCDEQDCIKTLSEESESHILRQEAIYSVEEGLANHPVIFVSWYGAKAYCEWAGQRLPTEAEWEKAARGIDGRSYPWGDFSPNCELANIDRCIDGTASVGEYLTGISPYGALDMAGNVWEWVADWYGGRDYYQISPTSNPQGPLTGQYRVIRGGAWRHELSFQNVRAAFRYSYPPLQFSDNIGFRCAQN